MSDDPVATLGLVGGCNDHPRCLRPDRRRSYVDMASMKELSTDVRVPFQTYFKEAMQSGRKRVTSRSKRLGEEGQTFVAFDCRFVLVGVHQRPLSWVKDYLWWFEGCQSPDAFVRVWVNIYKRAGWTPDRQVWVHAFGRIE